MDNALDGFVPYEGGSTGKPGSNKFTGKTGGYVVIIGDSEELYVGSTNNLGKRIPCNLSKLKNNNHHSEKLQNAYNNNPDVTVWVKPTNTAEEAIQLEQELVDKFLPTGKLSNRGVMDVTKPALGTTISEENKKKISERHLGKVNSKETRLKMSQAQLGKIHTDEAKQKMSDSRKEFLATDEGKIIQARCYEKTKQAVVCYDIPFPSVTEAAKALGVNRRTIIRRCKDDNRPDFFNQE